MLLERQLKEEYGKKLELLTSEMAIQQHQIEVERESLQKREMELDKREAQLLLKEKELFLKQQHHILHGTMSPTASNNSIAPSTLENRFKDVRTVLVLYNL